MFHKISGMPIEMINFFDIFKTMSKNVVLLITLHSVTYTLVLLSNDLGFFSCNIFWIIGVVWYAVKQILQILGSI